MNKNRLANPVYQVLSLSLALLSAGAFTTAVEAQPAEVELRFDHLARVEWVTGDAVEVEWLSLEDSRCAEGVVCVWEGQVSVSLAVTVNEAPPDTVAITLHAGDEAEATALVQGLYDVQLVGVEPYPAAAVAPERAAYRARITLSRRRSTSVGEATWGTVKAGRAGRP